MLCNHIIVPLPIILYEMNTDHRPYSSNFRSVFQVQLLNNLRVKRKHLKVHNFNNIKYDILC